MTDPTRTPTPDRPVSAAQLMRLKEDYAAHLTRTIAALDLRKWVVEQVLENIKVGPIGSQMMPASAEPGYIAHLETIMRQGMDPETILRLCADLHAFVSAPIETVEVKLSVE